MSSTIARTIGIPVRISIQKHLMEFVEIVADRHLNRIQKRDLRLTPQKSQKTRYPKFAGGIKKAEKVREAQLSARESHNYHQIGL
ncbi:hypothetical protein C7B69_05770 [filamentous cyanobacterium Phorm 46]|nr:hypothetical protein C7B69_05770 [filamentous cyanobacterium Phorm 46]PSB52353.1 hypothetical protein C7B67_07340 [filamentous cyanobacterium Phorm 6]